MSFSEYTARMYLLLGKLYPRFWCMGFGGITSKIMSTGYLETDSAQRGWACRGCGRERKARHAGVKSGSEGSRKRLSIDVV